MNDRVHKQSEPIPLHRVAVLRPFVRLLEDIGAPIERGFRQVGLPYSALEDVNNYVPSHRFWAFLIKMARSEDIADLGFRVGERFGADSADPHLTDLLLKSPTLYRGLLKASELMNRTVSHCRTGILQPSNSSHAYFYHKPSCTADNPAIEQIGWFGLTTLLGMVRVYTGPAWQPDEIGVMTRNPPGFYILEHFPRTRMRLSQPYSYISLDNAQLSLPPLTASDSIPAPSPPHYQLLSDSFTGTLEQALLAYLQESNLDVDFAAGLCNMSKRTLQRTLKGMGTHYSEVLDHARFRASSKMLQNPGMHVTDIAHRLGYSDVAHFGRAFRRIAGVTPLVYRQQFMH